MTGEDTFFTEDGDGRVLLVAAPARIHGGGACCVVTGSTHLSPRQARELGTNLIRWAEKYEARRDG